MTKAELIEALKPFMDETEILSGGTPARAWYVPPRHDYPAFISIDDETWYPETEEGEANFVLLCPADRNYIDPGKEYDEDDV